MHEYVQMWSICKLINVGYNCDRLTKCAYINDFITVNNYVN